MTRPQSPSPVHRDAAMDMLLTDPALAEAMADPAGFERLSDADVKAMRSHRRQTLGAAGAAMLVLAMGAGGWWAMRPTPIVEKTEHYATARGQREEIRLADGSSITLDGATTLDVALGTERRTVIMRSGEAYFDITHDPSRPFTVQAGTSSARVLGTAFDLDMMQGHVGLAVYRGAVRFGAGEAGTQNTVVRAGWRSRFTDGKVSEPSPFDVSRQDWRYGWLDADDMPLGEVVEAINRHGGAVIQLPAERLAKVRISGRFKLDDPGMLLGAIGDAYGFRVRHDGQNIRLEASAGS